MSDQTESDLDLTILILCLNEEKSIADCVQKARGFLERNAIHGEVLVADNNSEDRSAVLAQEAGARVVCVPHRGYGNTANAGIEAARGRFIILGDGDGQHDFSSLGPFLKKLQDGYDLVIGNRFSNSSSRSSTSFLNRCGNFLLSGVGKLFFTPPVEDFHCGLRAFRAHSARALLLQCPGMEYASEMIIKATQRSMSITEVPIQAYPAADPNRLPHLRPWVDGWRHLRLLLVLSPRWLFLYPGCLLLVTGVAIMVGTTINFGDEFGAYTMLYGLAFVVCGSQVVFFSLLAKVFYASVDIGNATRVSSYSKNHILEVGLVIGFILVLLGLGAGVWSVFVWAQTVGVDQGARLRVAIPSVALLIVGVQIIFSSFLLALLAGQKHVRNQQ